jgi:protein-disulfide isomerase-like protein with CxxC motif
MSDAVRFHLDPRCPWCWQTSKWMRRLAELDVVDVSWGVFCLEVQNFTKPFDQFDVDRAGSAPALRTMVAVRDRDPAGQAGAGRFYEAIGTRYFDGEEPLNDRSTVKGALEDAGLDPSWCDVALDDPSTWDVVLAEHRALCDETRSFGVPTIRLDGGTGPAIFGPVISNPTASDAEAVELWTHVSWLAAYENFSELKRDRTIDPDLAYWRTARARRAAEAAAAAAAAASS